MTDTTTPADAVTQDDVECFVRSLRMQGNAFADGCANLILMLWQARAASQPAQEPDAIVGSMVYEGNTVSYIKDKMRAYGAAIDRAWKAMAAIGHPADGKTPLDDAIRALKPAQEPVADDLIVRLDDLIKQATEERSHFYVRAVAVSCKAEILRLRAAPPADTARQDRMEAALRSIAANTCCDRCQEASLVARAALEREVRKQ